MTVDLDERLRRYGRTFEQAVLDGSERSAAVSAVRAHRPLARVLVPVAAAVALLVAAAIVVAWPTGHRTHVIAAVGVAGCNTLDPLDHPNAVVHFEPGTFSVPAGLTGQAAIDEPLAATNRAADPLTPLRFHVQETIFAPDPGRPKGQLAAFVRFAADATPDDVTAYLAHARAQPAVLRVERGSCPVAGP